jgi:hypothetical protein
MESLKGTKNIANSDSWFRDTPHYWAEASLPLAYAVACVEVVSKSSEKAGILYLKPDVIEADSCVLTTGQTWGCPLDLDIASISFCVVLAKPL